MSKNEEVSEPNWKDRIEVKYTEIKDHVERHKVIYYPVALIGTAVITMIVTNRVSTRPIMLAKKIEIKDSVLLIRTFEPHPGPPSWMVRSGDQLWRSQKAAAKAVGVSQSTMSQHLTGQCPHINGRVFERVAIEIGRKG